MFQVFAKDHTSFLEGTWLLEQGMPQKVRDSTSAYFAKFDTTSGVNTWLTDNVEEAELGKEHKPLDLDTLFRDFVRDTGAKITKKDFITKVMTKLGKRGEIATTRGVLKSGNYMKLQGYKLKEVLKPSSLDEQFRTTNGDMVDAPADDDEDVDKLVASMEKVYQTFK